MGRSRAPGTAARILDIAERLVQSRGYNAFSYADVAHAVGIRKASLHYHFATKADLGQALVARYRQAFLESLRSIETRLAGSQERLQGYVALYGAVLRKKRMCMCGMLATDAATLPRPMRESVSGFFDENVAWLARVLEQGRKRHELLFPGAASERAAFFVSTLEGAMLVAHGSGNHEYFESASRQLLATVGPGRSKSRRYGARRPAR